ncbi:hypothetical protein GCM10020331_054180 [Ectobacillus funiculus]
MTAPGGVVEVLKALLLNVVDNPVKAIYSANYIGILAWAIVFGLALRNAPDTTKAMISNFFRMLYPKWLHGLLSVRR